MIELNPLFIDDHPFTTVSVQLPKTHLMAIYNDVGYVMCGALDVSLLNEKLADRKIVAGRAVGVKTLDQLLEAQLESITTEAEKRGITKGMSVREALLKMT